MRRGDPACTANFEAARGLKVIGPDRRELPRGEVGLIGRGASVINTGGEKVYPAEVEEVLVELAGPLRAGQRSGC